MIPALTNTELEAILRYDTVLNFGGVFAIDQIPFWVDEYPKGIIFNVDEKNEPGSHWISIYFDSNKECQYFCPLATEPFGSVLDFVIRNSHNACYNKTLIQNPLSAVCGYYCIYHLVHAARHYKLPEVVNHFANDNSKSNDEKVFNFVNSWVMELSS